MRYPISQTAGRWPTHATNSDDRAWNKISAAWPEHYLMLGDEITHQLSDTETWQLPTTPLKEPASSAAHPRGLGAECHTVADAGGRHGGSVLGWCYLGITALWRSERAQRCAVWNNANPALYVLQKKYRKNIGGNKKRKTWLVVANGLKSKKVV